MSRDRQHRFRWETTRALGAAIRTICAPAPGTTLAGNDRPRAFPNRRPEVHNYPLGATSTPVFEKDLLRADGDGTGRSTHANQVLFAKYARSYIAINTAGAAQVQRRLRERFGERETVARAARRILRAYIDWGGAARDLGKEPLPRRSEASPRQRATRPLGHQGNALCNGR